MTFGKIEQTNLDFEEIPYVLKLSGVSWENRQNLIDTLEEGREVALKRDPKNKYDKNAIAVNVDSKTQIGWIPKKYAEVLAPEIDAGINWRAKVEKVIGEGKEFKGVLIKLFLSRHGVI